MYLELPETTNGTTTDAIIISFQMVAISKREIVKIRSTYGHYSLMVTQLGLTVLNSHRAVCCMGHRNYRGTKMSF